MLIFRLLNWVLNSPFDSICCPPSLQLLLSALDPLKATLLSGCRNLRCKCRLGPRPYLSWHEIGNGPGWVDRMPICRVAPRLHYQGWLAGCSQFTALLPLPDHRALSSTSVLPQWLSCIPFSALGAQSWGWGHAVLQSACCTLPFASAALLKISVLWAWPSEAPTWHSRVPVCQDKIGIMLEYHSLCY